MCRRRTGTHRYPVEVISGTVTEMRSSEGRKRPLAGLAQAVAGMPMLPVMRFQRVTGPEPGVYPDRSSSS